MDERELKEHLREEFDRERPGRDAYQAALNRAYEREGGRLPRWAMPVAAVLAVSMVTTLALGQRALRPPAARPAFSPAGLQPAEMSVKPLSSSQPQARVEAPGVHVAARSSQEALVSAGDVIERTEDGGQHWAVLFAGVEGHQGTVRDLEWVTGAVAFAATSYGLVRIETGPPGYALVNRRTDIQRLDFLTLLEGYAIAGDRVVKTADGGRSFAEMDVGLGLVSWIQWVTATRAWAAGPRGVVATSDGGRSWTREVEYGDPPDTSRGFPWTQVGFTDEQNGFAYHHGTGVNTLLHTSDAGLSWEPSARLPAGTTSDLVVTGPQSAELMEPSGPGRSSLCATKDSGMSWRCSSLPVAGGPGQLGARGATRWLALLDSGAVFAVSQDLTTWATRRQAFAGPPGGG